MSKKNANNSPPNFLHEDRRKSFSGQDEKLGIVAQENILPTRKPPAGDDDN